MVHDLPDLHFDDVVGGWREERKEAGEVRTKRKRKQAGASRTLVRPLQVGRGETRGRFMLLRERLAAQAA